jgi:hypothetical protein
MNRVLIYGALVVMALIIGYFVTYTPETRAKPNVMDSVIIQKMIELESIPEPKRVYKRNEQLSPKELKNILYQVGFRGERLREAWGTAMKESTGRPRSHNDNPATGDNSYGLFQINMIDSLGPARRKQFKLELNKDLFDPVRNAEIAFFMSNGGKNWSSWNGITDTTKKWMKQFPD